LVRDGTHAVPSSPSGGSAFTANPPSGPAGFTTLIQRVLDFALGAETQTGVAQPPTATTGLGPAGDLAAPYAAAPTLAGLASTLVAAKAKERPPVPTRLGDAQSFHDSLAARLSAGSAVNMDTEMTTMLNLQTAYNANARVLAVVQSLLRDVMDIIR